MDSLSYVFLAACSYATAVFLLCPFRRDENGIALNAEESARRGKGPWLLGALLMVLLDIVIDPVALQGNKWFLGQIYGYRTPGAYFGIPMSNFYGWLLVALVLVKVYQGIIGPWGRESAGPFWQGVHLAPLWGPGLYLGILLFNLAVTFAIGELSLGIASSFIVITLLVMAAAITLYKLRHPLRPEKNPSPSIPA
jgi:putative membrane protein